MRRRWIAAGIVGVAVAAALLDGDAGLRSWWRVRSELEATRERVAALRREVRALLPRDGEGSLGALGRPHEDLGLARPGETVLLLEGEDAPSAPRP